MSFRANSLRCVLLDGAFYAVAMGTALAALTSFAQDAQPRTENVQETTDRRLTDDHIDSQLNTDDNMPSGNPVESPEAKREAMMLGMKLYEVRTGEIRVDDIAATSPAWDAGIRRGDRLISIDTLRPRSLAPWVEEVGRLLADTKDGNSIPASIERDGETLALRIRVPVSRAAEVRDARQEERAIANMAAGNSQQIQQLGQPGVVPATGGDTGGTAYPYGGGYGGWGLGGFFDDGSTSAENGDRVATNAVARLMAVNTFGTGMNEAAMTAQSGAQPGPGGQAGGGQIGIAGFQDNGQGVRAAVVVRGLPPGMYQVGIGQGGMAGGVGSGGFGAGFGDAGFNAQGTGSFNGRAGSGNLNDAANGGATNPNRPSPQGARPIQRPGVQQPVNQRPQTPFTPQRPSATGGAVPAGGGAGGAPGAGGAGAADGASLASPRGVPILAQQLDATSQAAVNDPRGQVTQPVQAGAGNNQVGAGNANQPLNGATQNGRNGIGNSIPNGAGPTGGMGGPQFVAEIGVLRVGEDGSGRLENQLEGMQVQHLAGMSVIVVSPQAQAGPMGQGGVGGPQNPVAARNQQAGAAQQRGNRNVGNVPAGGTGGAGLNAAGAGMNARGQGMNAAGQGTSTGGVGMNGVVATGLIQLVENGAGANVGMNDPSQSGNQPQDRSASEELRDRNRIEPPSDFDPRSPR